MMAFAHKKLDKWQIVRALAFTDRLIVCALSITILNMDSLMLMMKIQNSWFLGMTGIGIVIV